MPSNATRGDSTKSNPESGESSPPSISLPKGGGAIHGIGEKFTSNPVTGTGSMSVPIATSPGRAGFGPQLALSYDSGSGNGPFGIGWSLSLPTITRRTDKGLPRYGDAEESDVFVLSGSEDLVPAYKKTTDGSWARDAQGELVHDEEARDGHMVKRYRPRIEGLFARIERWTSIIDGVAHWRSISKDNILSVYGSTSESRIADPANARRVFSWLICQSYDDKGNAIIYEYAAENDDNVDLSQAGERNRVRSANRYLKRIRYGNREPVLIDAKLPSFRRCHLPAPDFSKAGWMFEVLFDYGEGHYQEAPPDADGRVFATATSELPVGAKRPARRDPFSNYRARFELRSHRLCRRVMMFHHFPDKLEREDYLVRSTEFVYREKPNGSFVSQVVQSGFKLIAAPAPRYLKRSMPPVEFGYSVSPLDDLSFDQLPMQDVKALSLENLPAGIDGSSYRWVDLDGEGISGVLSEQADAWFYKPNLGEGLLGPLQCVFRRPALASLNAGREQLLDLAGDGDLQLVEFGGPTPGFFTRTEDAGWDEFRTFKDLPNIDWQDANLRFADLTGDGHADVLLPEQVFATWYESKAKDGFEAAVRVAFAGDEEDGPHLVFADGTQSIYLADMSGDGLSDLVRIGRSDVCYWPNLGYGHFGAKVSMGNAPRFDDIAAFDQRRVVLSDTDGSGPTDLVYLGEDGVRVYLNQHGHSLSDARLLGRVPRTHNLTSVSVVDFLGRGTACLLWSSPLEGDANRPLRYLDLMGGVKPHLLTSVRNNLGAETRIEYASSTQFYLADKAAGNPWITRLPFPVHVVTRVETRDLISGNRFVTRSAYHHGHFDRTEREFRGFGRVDQWDTEEFGVLSASGAASNDHAAFHVPPTLTKTWFHTGAYLAGARVSRHLEGEYFREGDPGHPDSELSPSQRQAMLLDDTVLPPDLAVEETREAIRSLKGAILRQEIYALDDLDGTQASALPYAVSERNYSIEPVQPVAKNRHSVFFTHARETLDFHYERKRFPVLAGQIVDERTAAQNPGTRRLPDPRVTHEMTLDVDDYGNVKRAVSIAYGRRYDDLDPMLTAADRQKQKQLFATLTVASFTNAVFLAADAYRTPLPAEAQTYELLKLRLSSQQPGITNLFRFTEMRGHLAQASDGAHDLLYEDVQAARAIQAAVYRRPIEDLRTNYRSNDLAQLLPLGTLHALALPGETYKLAFTPGLLSSVFQRPRAHQAPESLLPNPSAFLLADGRLASDRGGYVELDGDGRWWIPSGRVFFHPSEKASVTDELAEATGHFFLPRRSRDAFGRNSFVDYASDLLAAETRDALGNTVAAVHDYRVLQAKQLTDPNGNRSFVAFDAFGLPVATAVAGKSNEVLGDTLGDFSDFDADPALAQLQRFVARPADLGAALLKSATSRFVYDLDRFRRCGEPPFAAAIVRETHVSELLPAQGARIQVSFAYSDGFGRELQSKVPAEPGDAPKRAASALLPSGDISPGALTLNAGVPGLGAANPRWVGKGRTVYNNKGKPVKQYEPFFSSTHLYEAEPEMTDTGVTSIVFYDPVERVVATLHPNHTYEKVVFDPWRQETWDVNDTVATTDPKLDPDVSSFFELLPESEYLPTWLDQRRNGQKGPNEEAASKKALGHAATPTVAYFDTLGRPMLTIVNNGKDEDGAAQNFATRVTLDIEGNQRDVTDAKKRVVMRYDYDLLGNRIHQASMEAGERWMLGDVTGKPIRGWDSRGHTRRVEYDELRRPLRSFVIGADPQNLAGEICFEQTVYGEAAASGLTAAQVLQANLRGKPHRHYDCAGISTSVAHDFKGNLLRSTRQLVQDYKGTPNWSQNPQPALEAESFTGSTRFDALNRPIQVIAPHSDRPNSKLNVIRPVYNEANLLERVDAWLAQPAEPAALLDPVSANLHAVVNINYDAKGQRTRIEYGNGALTEYAYDERTFRLVHLKTRQTDAASIFQDLFYTYDPAGNITRIRDDAQQPLFFGGQAVAPQCDYEYDATYRLISASGREHIGQVAQPETSWNDELRTNLPHPNDIQAMRNYAEQYVYDAVGNIEKLIHQAGNGSWTRAYAYDQASLTEAGKQSNRLSSTTVGRNNPVTEAYSYDAHGNITSMPHLTLMQWDFRDQLSATSRQAVNQTPPPTNVPETTFYVYDAGGQRVRKVTERQNGSRKAERISLGGFEVFREFEGNGIDTALERETLHVMDDKQRVALVETRTIGDDGSPARLVRYQFGNHLGSASLELDDEANVISYEEYTPYGSTSYQAVDKSIKAAAKRYRFTGKERDEETGFAYHGARYYACWLGRWTSADPIGLGDGANLYAYVSGRPLVLHDGDGRQGVQMRLVEQQQLTIAPVARAAERGITPLQHGARKGLQYGFWPGSEDLHWLHPDDQPFVTQPAGTRVRLTAGSGPENVLKANEAGDVRSLAVQKGEFSRVYMEGRSRDLTVPPGTRFSAPKPEAFEKPLAEYAAAVEARADALPKFLPPQEGYQLSLPHTGQVPAALGSKEQLSLVFQKAPEPAMPAPVAPAAPKPATLSGGAVVDDATKIAAKGVLRKVAPPVLDAALLATQGKDENSSFGTALGILGGSAVLRFVPKPALYVAAAGAAGAAVGFGIEKGLNVSSYSAAIGGKFDSSGGALGGVVTVLATPGSMTLAAADTALGGRIGRALGF